MKQGGGGRSETEQKDKNSPGNRKLPLKGRWWGEHGRNRKCYQGHTEP